jgi:hypothetical protein
MSADNPTALESALERIQKFRTSGACPVPPRPTKMKHATPDLQGRIASRQAALHKLLAKSMTEPWPSMWDED